MKKFLKKNKFIILSLICLLTFLFGIYKSVYGTTYETLDFKFGKVNAKCLNVRCGPGMNYNRIGKLYKGEYIDVFAKVGNWYIVQTDSNLIGSVSADYIEAVYDENERYTKTTQTEIKGEQVGVGQEEVINQEEDNQENISQNNTEEFANSLELTKDEQEFLDLVNANRKNNGLVELKIDSEVQNIARLKAEDLVKNNYFSHTSQTYGDINSMLKTFNIDYEKSSENIAGNANLTGAIEAWMGSENHKVNILNEEYNYTGVAVVESSTYGKIFVEVFVKK